MSFFRNTLVGLFRYLCLSIYCKKMYQQTDEMVWLSCLQGNRKAFEELYKRYYALLFNYGKKMVLDADFVKDCLQSFFVKLIQNYATLSSTSSVRGYMLKAFRNNLYNALKAQNDRFECLSFSTDDLLSVMMEDSAETSNENSDSFVLIRNAFALLSSRQQEVLYLFYIMECSHADIAEAMNINYQSSKNLLFRSLSKLKESYLELQNTPAKYTENQRVELPSYWDSESIRYRLEIAK